jgi:taurine dioxygenase
MENPRFERSGGQSAPEMQSDLTCTRSAAALGAEISGINLANLDDRIVESIHRAWLERQVLLFRGQHLTDEKLIAFSRRFGELDHAPVQENGRRFVPGHPEIYVVSNVIENGVAIGSLGAGEAVWHTDMSYIAVPPKASVLYALEIPETGGDTSFCTMYGAWDLLPESLRQRIVGLQVKHDGTYNSGGFVREGVVPSDNPRSAPGSVHPLVCVHPETGRRCLYLGRRRNAYIEGMSVTDSEALLDEIWAAATAPSLVWSHQWRTGDVVMWDNRCTMHRRDAFDPASRRVLHRTQIKGEAPSGSGPAEAGHSDYRAQDRR